MIEKWKFLDSIKASVNEVVINTYNDPCIDVAASIIEQVRNFGSLAGIKPQDLVLKSIPTEDPTKFEHVWVEFEGKPIDPDREAQTEAGKEIREAIKKAEEEGNVQTNNQGLLRMMLSQ